MHYKKAVAAALLVATVAATAASAQNPPGLLPVWTRVGDMFGEKGAIETAEFSPDGRHIVTGSKYDDRIIVWRVEDGTILWERKLDGEIERVGFSPDGKHIVSAGEDETLRLWRREDGVELRTVALNAPVDGMAFSPNGRLLATGKEEGEVQLWSMPDLKLLRSVNAGGTVNSIIFTRDGALMLTAGHPSNLKVWRTGDLSLVRDLEGVAEEPLISVRLNHDDSLVVAGGMGGFVYVWRMADYAPVARFNHTGRKVEAVEFTPDGRHILAAGHDPHVRVVRVVDLAMSNIPVAGISAATGNAEYLDFNPYGSLLASAHEDGMLRLWLWQSGDADVHIREHQALQQRQRTRAKSRAAERAKRGVLGQ